MSTPPMDTAADRRSVRRRGWWLVPEVAALAVLFALTVPYLGAAPARSALYAAAAERAAAMLEAESPAERHEHGHDVTEEDSVFCGVHIFGTDPPGAALIDEVETIYGYYFCAAGRSGVPYLLSARADGPIVVHLGAAPSVQIPLPGLNYQEQVRAMMPDQYEQFCFAGLPDPTVADEVKRRYESELLS